MKNIKILPKFIIILLPVSLVIAALLVIMYNVTNNTRDEMEDVLYGELYEGSTNLINADRDFYQAYVAAILSTHEDEDVDAQMADLDENYQQVLDRVATAVKAIEDDEDIYEKDTLSSLLKANGEAASDSDYADMTIKELSAAFNETVEKWYATEDNEEGTALFSQAREYLNTMEDILDQYATRELAEIKADTDKTFNTIFLIVIAIVVVIAVMVIYIIVSIVRGIKKVNKTLNELAQNNLAFEPEVVKGKDEIGQMSAAALNLKASLTEAIGKVNSSAEILSDSIGEVVNDIDRSVGGVKNINVAVGEVADTSQQVATSAQDLSAQAIEMGDTIEAITESIDALKNASAQIDAVNAEAAAGMESVMNSSNMSVAAVDDITAKINETNEAVARIGECVRVIANISSQTNLLSLNASIEAARAGEAGRGFAVVADEIRELADSSAASAGEISNIVNSVIEISNKTVQSAKQISEVIAAEQESVKDTQEKISTLSTAVNDSLESINSIQQMSQGLEEIKNRLADATSTLSSISEELGASAEEVSATCTQVANDCEIANNMSRDMQETKGELTDAVGVFKL